MTNMSKLAFLIIVLFYISACSPSAADKRVHYILRSEPLCGTAKNDIAFLESSKAGAAERVYSGVTNVVPIPIDVVTSSMLTDDSRYKEAIASGDYNELIDLKIGEIKKKCKL